MVITLYEVCDKCQGTGRLDHRSFDDEIYQDVVKRTSFCYNLTTQQVEDAFRDWYGSPVQHIVLNTLYKDFVRLCESRLRSNLQQK